MRNKYLLGATTDGTIVFGDVEITHRNGYKEFTASFDTVRPFSKNQIDIEEYFENEVDSMDKECAYDLCEQYNCSPQKLAHELASCCNDPRDALDCSLYPKEIYVDDEVWYFESDGCGQHDTRGEMKIYTNKEAYDSLHFLWDEYHLKEIPPEAEKQLDDIVEALSAVDEEEWILNYIQNLSKEDNNEN